jgi:hypothetical protein
MVKMGTEGNAVDRISKNAEKGIYMRSKHAHEMLRMCSRWAPKAHNMCSTCAQNALKMR